MDGTLKTAKPLGLSRMLLKYHSKGKFKRVYWKKLIRKKKILRLSAVELTLVTLVL